VPDASAAFHRRSIEDLSVFYGIACKNAVSGAKTARIHQKETCKDMGNFRDIPTKRADTLAWLNRS
jgi:hypothetical protein